jgi:hypothetical protein
MKYKAYLKQSGEGCDYTIGCAQKVINIEATNMEEAKQKLAKKLPDYGVSERPIETAEIYEVNTVFAFDTNAFYDEIENKDKLEAQRIQDEVERREYERLKRKFG